jgi:flagellar basal-body rod protein FlgB
MTIKMDQSVNSLEASLDLRLRRQQLLASNVANIDTPDFKASDLKFDGYLKEKNGELQIKESAEIVTKAQGTIGLDGNEVNLDEQVSRLSENTLRYNTALELMRRKMALLRYASTEGRG